MEFLSFMRGNARWLSAGALMGLSTVFGQTFFISLYAGVWRAEFDLSHGAWGAIYMTATLASAAVLTQAGRLADRYRTRSVAIAVIGAFALVAAATSVVANWWMLALLVFGLRFCGQGMLSHLSVVAMGRWFRANRARAVAIAALGFAVGEAVLPAGALTVIGLVGWRASWLIAAALLVLVVAPLLYWLLLRERSPAAMAELVVSPGIHGRHWTSGEMIRHWSFWALLPGLIGPSWIGTVIFFQIVHLNEIKGWALIDYAAQAYPAFSVLAVASSFIFGWAVDKWGAARLLPVYLLGWAIGSVLMGLAGPLSAGVLALAIAGLGTGGVTVVHGALFAEFYGTRWLGGVKALAAALMVLGSALGPGVSGALLDLGVGFEAQTFGMGAYLIAVSLWFVWVSRRLIALTAPGDDKAGEPTPGAL